MTTNPTDQRHIQQSHHNSIHLCTKPMWPLTGTEGRTALPHSLLTQMHEEAFCNGNINKQQLVRTVRSIHLNILLVDISKVLQSNMKFLHRCQGHWKSKDYLHCFNSAHAGLQKLLVTYTGQLLYQNLFLPFLPRPPRFPAPRFGKKKKKPSTIKTHSAQDKTPTSPFLINFSVKKLTEKFSEIHSNTRYLTHSQRIY